MDSYPSLAGRAKHGPLLAAPCFAALFLVFALSGCRQPQAKVAVPVSKAPVRAYVDVERLLASHPDLARIHELDRSIKRASAELGKPVIAPMRVPEPVSLSLPARPASRPPAVSGVDTARAREAIREDFEIRRRGRPELEEERYLREMDRLRRRYLEVRREVRPEAESDDLALALANARRMSSLLEQLRSLQEKVEDRLFYSGAQLRRRRELYRLTQQDLEDLRREEARRLERALDPTEGWTRRTGELPQIPPAEIARLEQERDKLRQEALKELARLEELSLAAAVQIRVPEPAIAAIEAADTTVATEAMSASRRDVEARVRAASGTRTSPGNGGPSGREAVETLRREQRELRKQLLQELRAVAAVAGRSRGYTLTFQRGDAPDRTTEIAKDVRRLFAAGVGSGGK